MNLFQQQSAPEMKIRSTLEDGIRMIIANVRPPRGHTVQAEQVFATEETIQIGVAFQETIGPLHRGAMARGIHTVHTTRLGEIPATVIGIGAIPPEMAMCHEQMHRRGVMISEGMEGALNSVAFPPGMVFANLVILLTFNEGIFVMRVKQIRRLPLGR
jgi:hypothetical protein